MIAGLLTVVFTNANWSPFYYHFAHQFSHLS